MLVYKNRLRILFYLILTITTFFYIYQVNFSFLGIPAALHSRRIAAVILIIFGLLAAHNGNVAYRPIKKCVNQYILLCLFLVVYSYLQLMMIGKKEGVHIFDAMLNIILFGLPVYWAHTKIYSRLIDFMYVLLFVTIIQTFFIVACLLNENFATLMDLTFNYSEDRIVDMGRLRTMYAGGIGCITAPGSILYSLGLFSCSYIYLEKKKWYYLIIFAVLSIVLSMIARTGLLLIALCVLYILKQLHNVKKITAFVVPGTVVILIAFSFIISNSDSGFLSERYQRYVNLKENGFRGDFYDGYVGSANTYYPDLTIETIFEGTGMLSGVSGRGDRVNVDGGPLRVYSALGLLLAILVYLFILRIFVKVSMIVLKLKNQYVIITLSLLLIIGELKEPILFTVWPMTLFLIIAYLSTINNNECVKLLKSPNEI